MLDQISYNFACNTSSSPKQSSGAEAIKAAGFPYMRAKRHLAMTKRPAACRQIWKEYDQEVLEGS